MFLLPNVRLSGGECLDTIPDESGRILSDAKEVVLRLQRLGAVGLNVVDVDAATGGRPNDDAVVSILDAVHIPVQMGGGVTSLRRIQELRDTGVHRVLVGSMGVLHPDWMREAGKVFPEGVVATLDEKDGNVWVNGRTQDTGRRFVDVLKEFDGFGFEALLISCLNGTPHERLRAWVKGLATPVMVSTHVKNVGEILALGESGVQGVILGSEIYDGTIDLAEATKVFKAL
ncbi:MAG: hypothetical protein HYT80_07240 [Euryarchaeota archaeon]|nr:hypothetical protein [Euryarchaeota archaeon]